MQRLQVPAKPSIFLFFSLIGELKKLGAIRARSLTRLHLLIHLRSNAQCIPLLHYDIRPDLPYAAVVSSCSNHRLACAAFQICMSSWFQSRTRATHQWAARQLYTLETTPQILRNSRPPPLKTAGVLYQSFGQKAQQMLFERL